MASDLLSASDAAVASIRDACQKLADQLHFHFVTTARQPEELQPTQFTNYLVSTLPEAAGVFGGSKVELTCVVHMTPLRFWQVLREKIDLPEQHPMPTGESGTFAFRPSKFGWQSDLIRDPTLILRYCGVPGQIHNFPWQPMDVLRDDVTNWNALDDIEDAHAIRTWLDTCEDEFPSGFRGLVTDLTTWGVCNGLVAPSKRFGLFTVTSFIWMVHNFVDDEMLGYEDTRHAIIAICVPAILDLGSAQLNITATGSGRNVAAHLSVEALSRFRDAVKGTNITEPLPDSASVSEAKESFCKQHEICIILSCECWSASKQQHYSDLLITAATSFQKALKAHSNNNVNANIWPSVQKVDDTTEICLGITRLGNSDLTDYSTKWIRRHFISSNLEAIMTAVEKDCDWDRNEALLSVRFQDASQFQEGEHTPSHLPALSQLEFINTNLILSPPANRSSSAKFLDASRAISKLRWDPQWSSHEWEIGYEDRFDGLMWKNLEDWQTHTEEEDFIPTHRVRQIRLREEEVVFWNRDTRESSL